jgi:hypothetical protein
MPRRFFNDGMEIVETDLSAIPSSLEIELYDRLIYELMNRQQNVMFGDSLKVSYVNATTSQVKLGNGAYYDSTQVDPEPKTRLFSVLANTNVTHTTADAANNRIDIIVATPTRATLQSATRNTKNASTGIVSSTSQVVETDWITTLTVVAGTPSGSPAVPATPAGTVKLAEVLVTAVSGIAGSGAYTDKRTRFKKRSSFTSVTSISAAYTADIDDDESIFANANSASFAVTLPLASLCPGKIFEIVKTDSSANTVTVQGDTISDSTTQVLSVQFTTLRVRSNGIQYYMM